MGPVGSYLNSAVATAVGHMTQECVGTINLFWCVCERKEEGVWSVGVGQEGGEGVVGRLFESGDGLQKWGGGCCALL